MWSPCANDLVAHLTQHEGVLRPIFDDWYDSADCRKVIHYARQYKTRAAQFLYARPRRYTERSHLRLTEQYRLHASLLERQLRCLLALDFSASEDERRHSDIQEKNFASLPGRAKVHPALRDLAGPLDRRIRNALAHGVPEINWDHRTCMFHDSDHEVSTV
jgi:hypothetical protein